MSHMCPEIKTEISISFLLLKEVLVCCHYKNVQPWLFFLIEASNFLNDSRKPLHQEQDVIQGQLLTWVKFSFS